MQEKVITVRGAIDPKDMGMTLPHEHIIVDFIGAEKAGKHRYKPHEVVDTMLPYLMDVKKYGVKTFVDCTPMYMARDVEVLSRLSELTNISILTNTGQYKEPFLPGETLSIGPGELAQQWIREFEEGIDGTHIKPGFIKTAVSSGNLLPVQKKVIKAAAITSVNTGLTIATHTEDGTAAMQVLDILDQTGVDPGKWIYVHAQNEENHDLLVEVAKRGAWIELDNIGSGSEEKHMAILLKLLDAGYEGQILLSQDAGWYRVGEVGGGAKKPYTFLMEKFIPMMEEQGITKRLIDRITINNPARAFVVSSVGQD